jgi:hypothetical protein
VKMWTLCALLAFLPACHQALAPGPVTIADPMSYLADPNRVVRFDIGHYQETVSFKVNDYRAVTAWDYAPFGVYDQATGDGGEQYVIDGDTVRIEGTRDGGYPKNQYFVGKECGGTGWVLFRTDADQTWRELVARLGDSENPWQCSTGSSALTRYSLQSVNFPDLGARDAIISEHYDAATVSHATAMERSFFVHGRVAWQAFADHPPAVTDIATRCPDFGWQTAGPLQLVDCRISTQSGGQAGADLWRLGR